MVQYRNFDSENLKEMCMADCMDTFLKRDVTIRTIGEREYSDKIMEIMSASNDSSRPIGFVLKDRGNLLFIKIREVEYKDLFYISIF